MKEQKLQLRKIFQTTNYQKILFHFKINDRETERDRYSSQEHMSKFSAINLPKLKNMKNRVKNVKRRTPIM